MSVRQDEEVEGEDEEVCAVELISEKDPIHCLIMSSGECPGLRGPGWMILGRA